MRTSPPRLTAPRPVLLACVAFGLVPVALGAQTVEAPYSLEEVLFLLDSPMSQERIGQLATDGCLDFEMNAFRIAELREAGAELALIGVLNDACVLSGPDPESVATPVGSVAVTPQQAVMEVGATLALDALAVGTDGVPIENRSVTWSSSDPRVVSVTPAGTARALRTGTVTIIAESGGVRGQVELRVFPPAQSVAGVFAPGLIVPGASQFRVGRPARGAITVLAAAGAVAWGFTASETTQFCASPVSGGAACPPADVVREEVERPNLTTGAAVGVAIMLLSAIDAALHARGQNAEVERLRTGAFARSGPALGLEPNGAISASWRLHVH